MPVVWVVARDLAEFEVVVDSSLAGSGCCSRTDDPFVVELGGMLDGASVTAAQWSCGAWVDVCWCCGDVIVVVGDRPSTSLSTVDVFR